MRAVRVHDGAATTTEVPAPTGDGVVVRVASAGICSTDLHLLGFGLMATLGHEFAGWLPDGTPVAVEPLAPCGTCPACLGGDYHLCVAGLSMVYGIGRDGGMAESCLVREAAIVRLPAGVEPRNASLVEPLAVAVNRVRRGRVTSQHRVGVIGGGSIGLCAAVAAAATGARVDLVARYEHQRAAGERLGASLEVSDGYDVVIDAVGTSSSVEQAINLARAGGRVVYLGGNWEGLTIGPATPFALKEVDLVPSIAYGRVGPSRDIDVAASILAERPSIAEVSSRTASPSTRPEKRLRRRAIEHLRRRSRSLSSPECQRPRRCRDAPSLTAVDAGRQ